MQALTFNRFAPPAARFQAKPKPQSGGALARVRAIALFALCAVGACAAIIALRILFWAIGHPDQPFFREIGKLLG